MTDAGDPRPDFARPDFTVALARLGLPARLAAFDPHVAGTPPLGLALPESDIDILCHAPDGQAFARALWEGFSGERDFALRQWTRGERAIVAGFHAQGWRFELFGSARPVIEQAGWRHFLVERRLLEIGGALRAAVMARRRHGLKTEPAFADALALPGDPYEVVLEIGARDDTALAALLARAGFQIASS